MTDPLHPGGPGSLNVSKMAGVVELGKVGDLVRQLRANPFAAPAWVELGNEFLSRSQLDEAEIAFLASLYLFGDQGIPQDLQRAFFQVFARRRIRNDVGKSPREQERELAEQVNRSIPPTIAAVRESKERLEQELVACLNALEVDHGGV